MTEQAAAKVLKSLVLCGICTTGPCGGCERKQAKDAALSALEEIQKYRAIGSVEECREAKEKQIQVAPKITSRFYGCPRCGTVRSIRQRHDYCHDCGQAFYWDM